MGFDDVLRAGLILVLAAVSLASAACGGSGSTKAPLTLGQRLPTQAEISGWSPSLPPCALSSASWRQGGAQARWTTADAFWQGGAASVRLV
jgi:hypothetical protein